MAKPLLDDELWSIIDPQIPGISRRFRSPGRIRHEVHRPAFVLPRRRRPLRTGHRAAMSTRLVAAHTQPLPDDTADTRVSDSRSILHV